MTDSGSQRLLIIGAGGFLGSYAAEAAEKLSSYEVVRGERNCAELRGKVRIDVADAGSVSRAFEQTNPDCVLLLAAMADIDRCEARPEEAFAVNARGVEHVANICARKHARLVFTSTAAVFDGTKHGYREEDAVNPLSVYGKTKAWAESAVHALTPSAVVVRFGLLLGLARRGGTNAMLDTLVEKWKKGETVSLPVHEERNPVDAGMLTRILIDLLGKPHVSGTYHVGSMDSLSRYELGKLLAKGAGISQELVRAQTVEVPGRAPRGKDHFLLTDKIRQVSDLEVGTVQAVVERCFV